MRWLFVGDVEEGVGLGLAGLDTCVAGSPAAVVKALAALESGSSPYAAVLITARAAALAPNAVERGVQRTEPPLLVILPEPVRPAPRTGRA